MLHVVRYRQRMVEFDSRRMFEPSPHCLQKYRFRPRLQPTSPDPYCSSHSGEKSAGETKTAIEVSSLPPSTSTNELLPAPSPTRTVSSCGVATTGPTCCWSTRSVVAKKLPQQVQQWRRLLNTIRPYVRFGPGVPHRSNRSQVAHDNRKKMRTLEE